jgi:hypothetical protein
MATDIEITDNRTEWDSLQRDMGILRNKVPGIKVGVFGRQGSDLVKEATANEFGATINHPGGTDFGYKSQRDAEQGKVRFLKSGTGFMRLGRTGPHVIKIPERSFLRTGIIEGKPKIIEKVEIAIGLFLDGRKSLNQVLSAIGQFASSLVKKKISSGPFKPNAPATIKKKKSSKPLIHTRRMQRSITHEID